MYTIVNILKDVKMIDRKKEGSGKDHERNRLCKMLLRQFRTGEVMRCAQKISITSQY